MSAKLRLLPEHLEHIDAVASSTFVESEPPTVEVTFVDGGEVSDIPLGYRQDFETRDSDDDSVDVRFVDPEDE